MARRNVIFGTVALASLLWPIASHGLEKLSDLVLSERNRSIDASYAPLRCGSLFFAISMWKNRQAGSNDAGASEGRAAGIFLNVAISLRTGTEYGELDEKHPAFRAALEDSFDIQDFYRTRLESNYLSSGHPWHNDLLISSDYHYCVTEVDLSP